MIQMLRGNARKRPSLRRGYAQPHNRDRNSNLNINYRKIRALSNEERAALRKRIELEKQLRTRKNILALILSILILLLIIWLSSSFARDLADLYRYLN